MATLNVNAFTTENIVQFVNPQSVTITNNGSVAITYNFDALTTAAGNVTLNPGQTSNDSRACTNLHIISSSGTQPLQVVYSSFGTNVNIGTGSSLIGQVTLETAAKGSTGSGTPTSASVDANTQALHVSIAQAVPSGTNQIGHTVLDTAAKGTTAAGSPTSTAIDANTQALHVALATGTEAYQTEASTVVGLDTNARLLGQNGTNAIPVTAANSTADGVDPNAIGLASNARMFGYNGTAWDRLRVDSNHNLQIGGTVTSHQGTSSTLNMTASTVVKASAGRLTRINVIVAGSAAGTANDTTTTGGAAAANQIFSIPNTVGSYYLDWPCASGIVIVPGTGQTVAVSYE